MSGNVPFKSMRGFQGFLEVDKGLKQNNGKLFVDNGSGIGFDNNNKLVSKWSDVSATCDIDFNNYKGINAAKPTTSGDLANKSYVDDITGYTFESKLHPLGIPDDIISTHFDGEISENVTTSNGWVTKIWDATGKGHDYTATEAMKYTYNANKKRLEMTSTSGQRMKGTLPSGASNSTQPFSFTMVLELSEPDNSNWLSSVASVFWNIFNSGDNTSRINGYFEGQLTFMVDKVRSNTSNFWKPNITPQNAPLRLVCTANYNTNDDAVDIYINNRWLGQGSETRNTDEVIIGGDEASLNEFPFYGYIYECFYTHDSLSETQIGNVHDYLNDKWNVFTKPIVDIFAMAGQSNMVGKGDSSQSPNPEYGFLLDPQYWNSSRTRMNTIIDPVGTASTPDQASSGCSIPSFCQEYYDKTGRIPVILHVADGSTSLFVDSEWNPDYSGSNLSDDLINILSPAETHLKNAGWSIGKKSVLWHQGEADSGTAVQTYKDKFLTLVDKALNNGYEYFFYYEISEEDGNDFSQVREAQRLAHQERDNLYMIFSCANFHAQNLMSDFVHYNQEGYNLMGRQGAKSIANNVINNQRNKWYLNKARTDVDINDHTIINTEQVLMREVNINDDSVHKIPVTQNMGKIVAHRNTADMIEALYDLSNQTNTEVASLGSGFTLNTGSASGSTGIDGSVNLFFNDGNSEVIIENRAGSAITMRYCIYA